ncbi:MAG: DUF2231 domain-containing protein [Elusimicrobia bacterium]|nr:DUF2231 domain-containing protein [Elusimicrobiota bacterium]MDE2425844.1 DUF2231 domain-containing protein [Elusimicrobiota bacterium]
MILVHAARQLVSRLYIHPILVNFTAALVPVSLGSDVLERLTRRGSLRETGWWTMLYAACVTPFTALAGWLFWMKDDVGVHGMAIHKWLGTSLAVLIPALALWRSRFWKADRRPNGLYLGAGLVLLAALILQGHLGGVQVFKDM